MSDHEEADLSAWQLEFARLFAYPAEPVLAMEQHWWQDLAGNPEDFKSHQTMSRHRVIGTFNGARLSLTIDHNRIIWEVQPASKVGDLSTLGPFREKLDWVVGFLTPWLANSCPPIMRLAFGGKLLQAAATQREAFRILAVHLPGVKLEPNPNDFILQINRRTFSRVVKSLPINRICTWAKMNVVFSVEPKAPFEWPENCYSALELDINTAPENMEILPRQLLPALLGELADHAVRIAEHGDIADELWDHAK